MRLTSKVSLTYSILNAITKAEVDIDLAIDAVDQNTDDNIESYALYNDPNPWRYFEPLSSMSAPFLFYEEIMLGQEIPDEFKILQNYPNPFNPETKINFEIPEQSNVKLVVYDILGRDVITLEDNQLGPGFYEKTWRGVDEYGRQAASGIYFCRFYAKVESGKEYSKVNP